MKNKKGFLGPLPVMMILSAVIIDLSGMILVLFGLDDFGILDTLGFIVVGWFTWLYNGNIASRVKAKGKAGKKKIKGKLKRSEESSSDSSEDSENNSEKDSEEDGKAEKGKEYIKEKIKKKFLKRLGITSLIELIPYIGAISPTWIIMVYKELKKE